jgi:hypothetical protein
MATNDYNINPPDRNATNIQASGAPRVNFQSPRIPKNPWGGLSGTIDKASKVLSAGNRYSEAKDVARENFDEGLKQIYGLVKDGSYSEKDYRKLVREADGQAQRDGVISAWENWSAQHDVDEERTKIRIGAYTDEMNKAMFRMSNPSSKFATTFKEEDKIAFSALREFSGVDSQGNSVTMDTSTMSPIELILFSRGKMATKFAVDSAVNKLKTDRTIQGGITRGQAGIAEHVSKMVKADSLFPPDTSIGVGDGVTPGQKVRDLAIKGLKNEFLKLRELNVPNPNDVFVNAVASAVNKIVLDADLEGKGDEMYQVGDVLDALEEDFFSVREDDAGAIPFASVGTGTYDALEAIRGDAQKLWNDKIVAWNTALPDREEELKLEFMKKYRDIKATSPDYFKDPDNQEAFMDMVVQRATSIGVGDISQYRTQVEGLWKINPRVDADAPDSERYKLVQQQVYDKQNLTKESGLIVQANLNLMHQSDEIDDTQYATLSNALEANISAITTEQNAARTAVQGASDSITISDTQIKSRMQGTIKRMAGTTIADIITPDPELTGDLADIQISLEAMVYNGGSFTMRNSLPLYNKIKNQFDAHTKTLAEYLEIEDPKVSDEIRREKAASWLSMLETVDQRLGRSLITDIELIMGEIQMAPPDEKNIIDMKRRSSRAARRFDRILQATAAIHSLQFGEGIGLTDHVKEQARALTSQWMDLSSEYTAIKYVQPVERNKIQKKSEDTDQ